MDDSASDADKQPTNHDPENQATDEQLPDLTADTNGNNQYKELSQVINHVSALIKQKRHTEALEECNNALHCNLGHEKLLEKKIKVLCHLGQFQEAYDLAYDWKLRDPQHPVAEKEVNRLKIVLNALRDQESDDEKELVSEPKLAQTEVRSSPEGQEEGGTEIASPQSRPPTNIVLTLPPMPAKPEPKNEFVCTFCEISFKRQDELDTHCRSDLHKKRLTSDESQTWNYRDPPRGLNSEEYVLCLRFSEVGWCPFGDKCTQAHSEDELNEWKERFKFRRQQLQKARDSHLHGNTYTEQLLERLTNTENPKAVLVRSLDFVKVHVNSDLNVNMTSKKCTNAWTFTITAKICLHSVALLDDINRTYFYISSISVGPKKTQKYQNLENLCQEWINQDTANKGHGEYVYRVKVVFKTDLYGTFRQSIVFDFGLEAVMAKEMQVESAPVIDTEKLTKELTLIECNRWTEEKVEIVSFEPGVRTFSDTEKDLIAKYALPRAGKVSVPDGNLQKENYRLWMHEMLYLEELAQLGFVSRFNVKVSLQLVNRYLLMPGALSTAKYAHDGQLFAKMKLEDDLSGDSLGGRLILMNSQTALIAPAVVDSEGKLKKEGKVYETVVEDKGKNFIFLRLSARCTEELNLTCDQAFETQVQFQLSRLSKCEMHSAVDKLPTLDIVFPPNCTAAIPWTPNLQWNKDMDTKLNVKQKEAIVGVITDLSVKLPPLLIVGPFGTGKTFTMAQAAKQVIKQEDTRILICTHSNSAADLYITEFFHPYVEDDHPEARPLRVLYWQRWVQTVSDVVLNYCIYDKSTGTFKYPTKEDLEGHRIVITTLSTARYISDLDLPQGFFSHIFIDEAAQALECETLIPLSLAGESTRIVLAGDHMQLSPEVYSDYTRSQGFHMSLLERLYELYPPDSPCRIMLCENYRSHSAIVDFTSELFYDSKLLASGKLTSHNNFYPLTFYSAKGEEIQHQNSTGFYNNSEVYEIVERVEELIKKWPEEWGSISEGGIGVVAPYSDQVLRIRAEMRKKKMFSVSVERVLNVQGKQYRVIVISTVRTRHTCRSDTSVEDIMDYGFLSNVKLLNTAITRAQSLVIVVGDPVSLCLVGKCRKVWEHYLEICNKNNSFHGMTWSNLRSQLDGAEMTKTYVLNPLAPEFIPNRLFHSTHAHSEAAGQYLQGLSNLSAWQHMGMHPAMAAAYGHSLVQPMYQPPMMPYYPTSMYHPGYFSPMVYRPYISPRQGSPANGRANSPKSAASQRGSPMPPAAHSARGRPEHGRPAPDGSKVDHHSPHMKMFYKQPKGRMMVYLPQRLPMAYPHYYHPAMLQQHQQGYFYVPDDHHSQRMLLHQPPFIHQGPRFAPHGPVLPYSHQGLQPGDRGQSSGPSSGSNSNVSTPTPTEDAEMRSKSEERTSPSMYGQKIRLMPGVKHVPAHLLTTDGKESGSRSNSPGTSPPSQAAEELKDEKRSTPVSERPYSPANYAVDRQKAENKDKGKDEVKSGSKRLQGRKQLKLTTGFSRQFSDDLPTPTEITDLVKMIEESIDEEEEENSQSKAKTGEVNSRLSSLTKLKLNLPNGQNSESAASESSAANSNNSEKLSYAGVLRKPRLPTAQPGKNGTTLETPMLEPQTPRTPSGFITPGAETDLDPFGILKSLNIEPSSQHHCFPRY